MVSITRYKASCQLNLCGFICMAWKNILFFLEVMNPNLEDPTGFFHFLIASTTILQVTFFLLEPYCNSFCPS